MPSIVYSPAGGELARLTAAELLRGFRERTFSPADVLEQAAARIEALEPEVNAFVSLDLDRARAEARLASEAYAQGRARALEGVLVGVKDIFDAAGFVTTNGSALCSERPERDAAAVRRLREAGAIVVGKTMTHEFAWGITTVNPHFGPTRNPWDPERIAGGSSGGSAAALAAHMVPLALGSDTGGSIRIPAAFCGVAGLKPGYGCVSTEGVFPLAPSLDHAGPMARTPADLGILLEAIAEPGHAPGALAALDGDAGGLRGVRVGVSPDLLLVPLAADVERVWSAALDALAGLGAELVDLRVPEAEAIHPAFVVIQRAEALHTHRRAGLYPDRRDGYGDDVAARLDAATAVTLEAYLDAAAQREQIRAGLLSLFSEVDLLVTPVAACSPPTIESETTSRSDGPDLRDLVMPYTLPQDLTGLPACAICAGFDDLGLPVAVQLTGPPRSEARVLHAAAQLSPAVTAA